MTELPLAAATTYCCQAFRSSDALRAVMPCPPPAMPFYRRHDTFFATFKIISLPPYFRVRREFH